MAMLAYAPAYIVPLLANLISIYALTRILPPEQYGTYAYLMGVMLLCEGGLFASVGMGTKRFFERAAGQNRIAAFCTTMLLMFAALTIALVVLCGAGIALLPVPADLQLLLWLSVAVIFAKQLSHICKMLELVSLFRRRYVLMECADSILGVASGLYLCWYLRFGADGILYGMLIGSAVVILFDANRVIGRLWGGRFDGRLLREIAQFALPISITFFIEYLAATADRFMIQFLIGVDLLGIYAVGYGIADRAVGAVFLALAVGFYPMVVRALERHGREAARREAAGTIEILVAVVIPAFGGFVIASRHIAAVLVGPAYAPGAAALMPLSALAVLLFALRCHYYAYALHLSNRTWSLLTSSAPAVVVNLGLNAALLPSIGLIGAVWAKVIAYGLALTISVWQARRWFPLPFPMKVAVKAIVATVIMCTGLSVSRFPENFMGLVTMVSEGGAIYLLLAICLNIAGLRGRLALLWDRYRGAPNGLLNRPAHEVHPIVD